ncbi:putative protein C11orf53 [Liparis tanakae]|uniref:Uncharacterized protein n=1 Tax=Liparis tanakae TaxID=230148 RepID=A0A4Z2E563_9TELE|nr:putative protein C11orf53 [Liparis tanakae]
MLPSYYGMRRPFISDSDFCPSTKQFSPDVFSPSLAGKALEPSAMSGYSSFMDYYPETFGDYRSAAAFSGAGGSFLPAAALSSLLPPYGGEASHLYLVGSTAATGHQGATPLARDSWEQPAPEPPPQAEALCPDGLASVSAPPSMPSPEAPGSPSHYRSPSRASSMGGQPYTLHPLEEAHYHALTTSGSYPGGPSSSSFPCPSYMGTPISDLVTKMVTEEASDGGAGLPPGEASWAKEDGVSSWSPYEIRRAY